MGEEMFITPIQPIGLGWDTEPSSKIKGQEGIGTFKSIFEEAIADVRSTERNWNEQQYLLATGVTGDPHTAMIAASEAQLATDMLVQLRTRALEAYNEIMRIQL